MSIMDKMFWNSSKTISEPSIIKDFFDFFALKEKTYEVIVIVNKKDIEPINDYFNLFELMVNNAAKITLNFKLSTFFRIIPVLIVQYP